MGKRGYNTVSVHRSLKLITTFRRRQLEENKMMFHPSDFVAQTLLKLWEETFLKDFTKEEFNEEMARYSVTAENRNKKKKLENIMKAEKEERKLILAEHKMNMDLEKKKDGQ